MPTAAVTETAVLQEPELARAIAAAGEAAYHWNIVTDELTWGAGSAIILDCPVSDLLTGKHFAQLLEGNAPTTRYDVITGAKPGLASAPYQIRYRFCPKGPESAILFEDTGRWIAGRDGKPAEAFGVMRRIEEQPAHAQKPDDTNRDSLTGMMNRQRLTETVSEAIETAQREASSVGFALAAVNNLSLVNEAYGYEVADEVILAIAKRLQQALRSGDVIARYSGGKFGIVLTACSPKDLPGALDRFLAVVRDSVIETNFGPVWAMLSIGGISIPDHADTPATAMARAEEALSEARRLPTDGVIVYQPSEQRRNEQHLNTRCASEIVQSLKDDDFKLAFQPIKDARTGKIVMHEALLRMIDDGGEIITAGHLIPVAERLGLVRLIDRAVTQMTLSALHSHPDAKITMNISAVTATDKRWHNQIVNLIEANKTVASRLIVELTETVALNDLADTRDFISKLRELGCGIAIDDFGAGYTSFRNIRDLPVTAIKLDGSFCRNLAQNKDNLFFVKSLVELAHSFNLKIVAEWVESAEDEKLLIEWGVDYLQGNYVGHADVKPAWYTGKGAEFDLSQREPPPAIPELQPAEQAAEQAPEPIAAEADTVSEPAAIITQPAPAAAPVAANDELFEFDISRLRGALDLLNQHFPGKQETEAA